MSRSTTRVGRRTRACALGAVTVAAVALLGGGAALAAPSQAGCANRTNNTYDKLLECVRVEGVRKHQAALQAIADRERRQPLLRLRGLRRLGRLRGRHARGRRLRPRGPDVRLPRVRGRRPLGPPADRAGHDHLCRGRRLRRGHPDRSRRRHSGGHGRRPAARPRQHLDQRLRGGRLRRLPRRQHRAAAARDLHVRDQGRERRGGRRRRDRDLQPGQHGRPRPQRHPGRHAHGQQHQRHPGARHHLRARCDAGQHAGPADAGLRQHAAPDPAHLQRAGREDRHRTTTTSSWPARTSTRCSRGRASTTTARAAPPSSRPRSRSRS